MFGSADVVAQSLPVYGAFNHWWVLLWLAAMAGCLLVVAGIAALYQLTAAWIGKRCDPRRRLRIHLPTDGTSNP